MLLAAPRPLPCGPARSARLASPLFHSARQAARSVLVATCAGAAAWTANAQGTAVLDAEEIEMRVLIEERQPELERTLERWVNLNTGSLNLEGLSRFAQEMVGELQELGFEVELEAGGRIDLPGQDDLDTGPLVTARREGQNAPEGALKLLLVGHYDTVFEPDSPFQRFQRDPGDPDRATGPGVADMKGGLVVLMTALRALRESGSLERTHVRVLLNGDEEIGSLASRERIEAAARDADYGFVFESTREDGAMVRSRRGLGQFHLDVTGLSAHAGSAHDRGRSAIAELAHKILAIEGLTDYSRGVTLNVGTVSGGTKRNVVPDHAEAWIDLRYANPEDGPALQQAIEDIAGQRTVPDTETQIWGTLHRPPKPAGAKTEALLAAHAQLGESLGVALPPPVASGGGTDGSLMSAVGLPTLDSMGAVGGGAHTEGEFILLSSLSERAILAAALLRRLIVSREQRLSPGGEPQDADAQPPRIDPPRTRPAASGPAGTDSSAPDPDRAPPGLEGSREADAPGPQFPQTDGPVRADPPRSSRDSQPERPSLRSLGRSVDSP